jgi:hypothetical protein
VKLNDTGSADDPGSADSSDNPTLAKITLSCVISLIAIGHVFRPKVFDEFVTLLLIVALSPWLVPFFSRYISSVDAFGAKFEFQALKDRVDTESQRLDQLYRLSMGDNVFTYLRKLSQEGGFGPFYVSPAMPREIAYLEELGYIRFKGSLRGTEDLVDQFPDQKVGANLSDYIELTDAGKSFYRLRNAASLKPADHLQPVSQLQNVSTPASPATN